MPARLGGDIPPGTMETISYLIGFIIGLLGGLGWGIGIGLKLARKWLIEALHDEGLLSDEDIEKLNSER